MKKQKQANKQKIKMNFLKKYLTNSYLTMYFSLDLNYLTKLQLTLKKKKKN